MALSPLASRISSIGSTSAAPYPLQLTQPLTPTLVLVLVLVLMLVSCWCQTQRHGGVGPCLFVCLLLCLLLCPMHAPVCVRSSRPHTAACVLAHAAAAAWLCTALR